MGGRETVTSQGYAWEPNKMMASANSKYHFYLLGVFMHRDYNSSLCLDICGKVLFFFLFLSPHPLHMHSPSTQAHTFTSTFSLKNTDHRYGWWFMGEEDRNYFFLKILVYFSWLTPILVWRQPQSCVHWMILFHSLLSSSLSLINQQ